MTKSKEKFEARELRKKGKSIKEIADKLEVSKGSVSLWCNDVELTDNQKLKLHNKMIRGSYAGRMIGVRMQKDKKKRKIEECLRESKKEIPSLNEKELLIAGVSLYWGEGSKTCSNIRFCNSNEKIVLFIMKWFRRALNVEDCRFMMYVSINEIHKHRLTEVVKYWSRITRIPIKQFRKPTLIKVKNKKVYENFSNHHGTLTIRISKSKYLLYKILGLIEALSEAG